MPVHRKNADSYIQLAGQKTKGCATIMGVAPFCFYSGCAYGLAINKMADVKRFEIESEPFFCHSS
jgi:hypothetical protein